MWHLPDKPEKEEAASGSLMELKPPEAKRRHIILNFAVAAEADYRGESVANQCSIVKLQTQDSLGSKIVKSSSSLPESIV